MAGFLKKVIKGLLIGAGTVLSIIPGGAAIGGPLIVAGVAIKTSEAGTIDNVSAYGAYLVDNLPSTGAGGSSSQLLYILKTMFEWIKKNILLIALGLAAIIFLPKFLRRRGRRHR